jgi:energy-coupling factor transporter ATP-binding protein EcfA2
LIKYLKKWQGVKTVLMVTHTQELLMIADKVIFVVGDGRALMGAPAEIMKVITQHFGYDFKSE